MWMSPKAKPQPPTATVKIGIGLDKKLLAKSRRVSPSNTASGSSKFARSGNWVSRRGPDQAASPNASVSNSPGTRNSQ